MATHCTFSETAERQEALRSSFPSVTHAEAHLVQDSSPTAGPLDPFQKPTNMACKQQLSPPQQQASEHGVFIQP